MRPLRLRLVAFGPFAGEQVIDFEQLGPAALFLIEGATGAGKTTILDAICYALYDKSTGGERDARQMRSDFAAADRLTEVELEFLLGAERYRIRRVPEQTRPRQRGEGTTKQAAIAELYRRDGGAEVVLVARKVNEANAEIARLTGLTVEQFRQVMVLPQGQFRKLLTAESKERQAILQNLFGTELYSRIAESLRLRTSELAARDNELGLQRDAIFRSLGLELNDDMGAVLSSAAVALTDARTRQITAESALQACLSSLADAEQLAERFAERSRAMAMLEQLDEGQAEHEARETLLSQLDAAMALSPLWQVWTDRQQEYANSVAQAAIAEKALVAFQRDEAMAQTQLDAAEQRLETRESTVAELHAAESMLPLLAEYDEAQSAHRKAVTDLALSEKSLEASATNLRESDLTFATLTQQHAAAQLNAAALPGLEAQHAQLQRAQHAVAERETLQAIHAERVAASRACDARLAEATRALDSAKALRAQAEALWESRQAVVLASALRGASPCPVCGSTEHPAPAGAQGDLLADDGVDVAEVREREDAARALMESAQSAVHQATAAVSEVAAKLAALDEAGGAGATDFDPALRDTLASAQASAAAVMGLAQSLDSARQLAAQHQRLHESSQRDHQVALQAEAAAQARSEQCRTQLGESVPDRVELDARVVALRSQIDDIDGNHRQCRLALENARLARVRATTELESLQRNAAQSDLLRGECEASWLVALSESAFDDVDTFLSAIARVSERAALASAHSAYLDARRDAAAALAVAERAVAGRTEPDLERERARRDTSQSALEALNTALAAQQARVSQLDDASTRLASLDRDRAQVEADYRVAGSLSQAANGQNPLKLNLQSFVLAVLLDDVLLAAGERLQRMTRGRYQLVRREGVTHGGRQAGLDLDVDDAHTGRRRRADTLSGGESFMAALALALGLSDVVQAHAGGIRLDTLFIDEGFGSLDPDSLDLAVRALVDLQSSGRLVGVISHVPELAEQIQSKLQVRSGSTGSRAKLIVNPGMGPGH